MVRSKVELTIGDKAHVGDNVQKQFPTLHSADFLVCQVCYNEYNVSVTNKGQLCVLLFDAGSKCSEMI